MAPTAGDPTPMGYPDTYGVTAMTPPGPLGAPVGISPLTPKREEPLMAEQPPSDHIRRHVDFLQRIQQLHQRLAIWEATAAQLVHQRQRN